MSKIALVGDLHLAPKCENAAIREHVVNGQHAFIDNMLSNLRENGVDTIVFAGDIFTNRQFIAVDALNYVVDLFSNKMKDFEIYVIAGNHDMMYENRDDITSLSMLSLIPNVHMFNSTIGTANLLGKKWYFVPWLIPEKMSKFTEWLAKLGKNRENTVIVGHFEMYGALMEAGQRSENGFDTQQFYHAAKWTFSGHYHCRSSMEGEGSVITYLGSPYQLSFAHVDTDCGYYLFDGDTLEFIENTLSPRFIECIDTKLDDLPDMSNSFVRYYMQNDRDFEDAAMLKAKLAECSPIYIKSIPYGGDAGTIEEQRVADDDETRRIMSLDEIEMAKLYMDKHPEKLPVLKSGKEPVSEVLRFINEYRNKRS